ncbi:hypothetical protein [Actinomadura parmotrematis]|uniref:Uncharacterized protein n=1 Tax=Actinomadura parmotrematis TaxID=2864039 RepID=A0ABS7FNQ5_9ACTN|nr:hypothetical protein [Actinomadura parmotrematis]MBW8482009.1 hypothetical protein [Actinomadura parmotrematis]
MALGLVERLRVVGLEREFCGQVVSAWHGHATGTWWALVRARGGLRLVEAVSSRELRDAVVQADRWPWPNGCRARAGG